MQTGKYEALQDARSTGRTQANSEEKATKGGSAAEFGALLKNLCGGAAVNLLDPMSFAVAPAELAPEEKEKPEEVEVKTDAEQNAPKEKEVEAKTDNEAPSENLTAQAVVVDLPKRVQVEEEVVQVRVAQEQHRGAPQAEAQQLADKSRYEVAAAQAQATAAKSEAVQSEAQAVVAEAAPVEKDIAPAQEALQRSAEVKLETGFNAKMPAAAAVDVASDAQPKIAAERSVTESLPLGAQVLAASQAVRAADDVQAARPISTPAENIARLISASATEAKGSAKGQKVATQARPNQAKFVEKIQQMLDDAVKMKDSKSLVLRLDPPEIGKLTIKLTQRSDELFARIIPENKEVEETLRQKAGELKGILQSAGLKANEIHVSIGHERSETEAFRFQDLLGHGNSSQQSFEHSGAQHGQRESGNSLAGSDDRTSGSAVTSAVVRNARDDSSWVA